MGENIKTKCAGRVWNPWLSAAGKRRRTPDANWKLPLRWNRHARQESKLLPAIGLKHVRPRVFPSCDIFKEWTGPIVNAKGNILRVDCPEDTTGRHAVTMADLRCDMFGLFDQTPNLDWLLLTKWPENIREFWPEEDDGHGGRLAAAIFAPPGREFDPPPGKLIRRRNNVWLLYSASDQESLEAGIDHLLKCRDLSPVLGLSLEPLIGPICIPNEALKVLGWIILGGESDPNARPCHLEWILDIVEQCKAAGVPCFVKQDSGPKSGQQGRIPDVTWNVKEYPNVMA